MAMVKYSNLVFYATVSMVYRPNAERRPLSLPTRKINIMKQDIKVIEINGVKYVPQDSIVAPVEHTGDIKIVVLQRGWVYIGRFERIGNDCKLHNASCIRTWGTTKGLAELVNGATNSTKLDRCEGLVEFDWLTVIHTITVNQTKWTL